MNITLIQTDIAWQSPADNIAAMESAVLKAFAEAPVGAKPELVVLPEMWSTGFVTDPRSFFASHPHAAKDALAWMQSMADFLDAAIAGSIAVKLPRGGFRNRMYFVKPSLKSGCHDTKTGFHDTKTEFYDKRHLFTYGGEDTHYTAGRKRKVVEWRGVRFLLQVCYDLRFPVFSRNSPVSGSSTLAPYDVALYVASWPSSRRAVWDTLLKARAIENQCYVVGVNRVGSDPQCSYDGGTTAIDPYGRVIAICPDSLPHAVTIDADTQRLAGFRKKFPVLNDADRAHVYIQ